MNKLIEHFNDINRSFNVMKQFALTALAVSGIVVIAAVALTTKRLSDLQGTVYVVDRGSAVMASRSSEDAYRDIEAKDHVLRFHELMLNVTPNAESVKRNLDRALILSDKSAYDYYMDLSEKGFYQRMISANITQEFVPDSVKVDMETYPYT
ncbi:MAG: hypothetical protein IKA33_00760, partial [Candidatus Methanomethylophilaceae archaeon]|nr:hypothetical protein [Candidatus Methanomethylophilaceae archaeon]